MPSLSYSRQIPEDLVQRLRLKDSVTRLRAIKDIKNHIIGSQSKKRTFLELGAVPIVLNILQNEEDNSIRIQCIAVIGSFAFGCEAGVREVLNSGGLSCLFDVLSSDDEKLVVAAARSLKAILTSKHVPHDELWKMGRLEPVFYLLKSENLIYIEMASFLIARLCRSTEHQTEVAKRGGMSVCMSLLAVNSESTSNYRQAAIEALVSITRGNVKTARILIREENIHAVMKMIALMRENNFQGRLSACHCIVNLTILCPGEMNQELKSHFGVTGDQMLIDMFGRLVKLLEDPRGEDLAQGVPEILNLLLKSRPAVMEAAVEAEVVVQVASLLLSDWSTLDGRSCALLATLAVLCEDSESNREQLIQHSAWPLLLHSTSSRDVKVVVPVCHCIRNVFRSPKNLHLHSVVPAMTALIALLDQQNPEILVAACGALSNTLMTGWMEYNAKEMSKFSNNKNAEKFSYELTVFDAMEEVNLPMKLKPLVLSSDPLVAESGLRALKNFAFSPESRTRSLVLDAISSADFVPLLHSSSKKVAEQAASVIRNLFHGCCEVIDRIMRSGGELLLSSLGSLVSSPISPEVTLQAIHAFSNLAASSDAYRDSILSQLSSKTEDKFGRPTSLHSLMQENIAIEVRLACMLCLENLFLPCPDGRRNLARLRKISQLSFESTLRYLATSSVTEVEEKAASVLTRLCETQYSN